MGFKLEDAVPWGKNLDEYKRMFNLSESDLGKRIISFADGTSSFNSEMSKNNHNIISLDPIYQFEYRELKLWIDAIIGNIPHEPDLYAWNNATEFRNIEKIRFQSVKDFMGDFEIGKKQKRYISYEFPQKTDYSDQEFDIGLCANFLLLYSQHGLGFHEKSIKEMLRLCREIRIFPILDLSGQKSNILEELIRHFNTEYLIKIIKVDYGFQDMGYEMLSMKWK